MQYLSKDNTGGCTKTIRKENNVKRLLATPQ